MKSNNVLFTAEHFSDALVNIAYAGDTPDVAFTDGGLTISSLQPLRGVPHRVVCIVGLDDQGGAGPAGLLGDDLIAQQPLVGDRDPRG